VRESLENARQALLLLHRAVVDAERLAYERAFGRIQSNGALLQLLLNDPWFGWLRPISGLIVQIDEWLEAEEPSPGAAERAESLMAKARENLRPSEEGTEIQRRLARLLQENPSVVMAHSAARKIMAAE
jgi:hypothetical protein